MAKVDEVVSDGKVDEGLMGWQRVTKAFRTIKEGLPTKVSRGRPGGRQRRRTLKSFDTLSVGDAQTANTDDTTRSDLCPFRGAARWVA